MKLKIMTPSKKVLEEEVKEVYLPGFLGEFGVLKGHAEMISSLCGGKARFKTESGSEKQMTLGKGVARVFGDNIEILTEKAAFV